uniref:Uncharacterized protein n=1 Tax=Catharus ustulatus TaxID=91951 RepID=A0A8C3U3K6_CATUS
MLPSLQPEQCGQRGSHTGSLLRDHVLCLQLPTCIIQGILLPFSPSPPAHSDFQPAFLGCSISPLLPCPTHPSHPQSISKASGGVTALPWSH